MRCTNASRPTPCPERRRRPTGCSTSSAAGPSSPPRTESLRASTSGADATSTGWPSSKSGWPDAVAGPTLLHGDVRSDNVLVTDDGVVVFVDWPHACVGTAAFDLVAWAPSVTLEGGPAPEELLALSEATPTADRDVLAVLVAAFSGFLVTHSLRPSPPGLPTLRAFQAAQGAVASAWLQRLTGW